MPSVAHDTASPSHSERRTRAARLTLTGSAAAKVFAMLCTFAQVPIALRHLGGEGYGLWITLMSVFGLLHFVDFGLGVGMQREMSAAFARDDRTRLRQAFASGFTALTVLGAGCLVIGLPLAWWGDWGAWFKVADPQLRAETPAALAVLVAAFALGLPGNAVAHLAAATQLHWWHSLWNALGNGLTLLAVWLAARSGWSFLPFVAVTALLPAVQNAGMWWQLRRRFGWQGRGPGLLSRTEFGQMLRASSLFAVPQLTQAALGWLPAFVISLGAGAGAVTAYNLLQRLCSPITHGHGVMLMPLWPMYAEARVRGDRAWLHAARDKALRATLAGIVGIAIISWQVPMLVRLWVGTTVTPPAASLTWAAATWFALHLLSRHLHYYLLGLDRLRPLALYSLLGFSGAAVGLLAGSHLGGAGWTIALGSVGFGLLGLPGLALASRDHNSRPH